MIETQNARACLIRHCEPGEPAHFPGFTRSSSTALFTALPKRPRVLPTRPGPCPKVWSFIVLRVSEKLLTSGIVLPKRVAGRCEEDDLKEEER